MLETGVEAGLACRTDEVIPSIYLSRALSLSAAILPCTLFDTTLCISLQLLKVENRLFFSYIFVFRVQVKRTLIQCGRTEVTKAGKIRANTRVPGKYSQ